uniref:Cytochrome c oxidase subunit 2 n=1 Tax=Clambus sp. CLA01 TaxID=1205546 RepID=A0A0S2MN19_9COLE|nr:cytochrome c oxidase subunit 2 [Clambus sp. CLA01]
MATWPTINLMDGISPLMQQLQEFHNNALMVIFIILIIVGYAMISLLLNKNIYSNFTEGHSLETFWTFLPGFILVLVALPSVRLLYLIEESLTPSFTFKIIGNQWYWSYEYSDFNFVSFDSYMIPTSDLSSWSNRLLEVDNRVVLPYRLLMRSLITSHDVLHSWAIPNLGVKMDAVPGRLNQVNFMILYPGLFYGQCSEICGANHSFMPIVIESVSLKSFTDWIKTNQN